MIKIDKRIFNKVIQTFHYDEYEKGGLLILRNDRIVDCFLDIYSQNRLSYHPSEVISIKISEIVYSRDFFAFVHSHPKNGDTSSLSFGDMAFAKEFLELNRQFEYVDMALSLMNAVKYYRFFRNSGDNYEEFEILVENEPVEI